MKKILYVEDNPDNYRLVKTLLERSGYEVVGAADGIDAITRARREDPDLILMDINIPSLSGYEVTTKIKSIPGLEDIPVVAVTAKTMKGDKDMALAAGCVGFIAKPLDPFTFVQEVESFLKGRQDKIPDVEEQTVLREYSRKLVTNLEEKVTQLQEINRKLQESEERYRTLVENVNIGIWFLSPQRYTLFLNQRMRDLLEIGNLDPLSPDKFLDSDKWLKFQSHLQRCADGEPQLWESMIRTHEGHPRQVVVSGVAVLHSKKELIGYLLSFLDVTEKKELEHHLEQVHKLESLSTLTAGVAHDFNNILTIILNNDALLLQRVSLPEEDMKRLVNIDAAAHRGSSLTAQLLAFSREAPPNLQLVDPVDLVLRFCKFFSNYKNPQIHVNVPSYTSIPKIMADPVQVEQVLLNLATNAQDAMPRGGEISFDIHLESRARDQLGAAKRGGEYVCLVVRDTGGGIDPSIRHKIFEPFFTTKPAGKGTGLGLSAVYGIVKKHEGFIEVGSETGIGTEFRIYLPVAGEKSNLVSEVDLRILKQGKYTVLVVENDGALHDLLLEIMTKMGLNALFVEDVAKAGQVIDSRGPEINIALLDYPLPGGNLNAIIQKFKGNAPHLRVVLTSEQKLETIKDMEGAVSLDGYLKKPFDLKTLGELFQSLF